MRKAWVGLGSNLGDPSLNLENAARALAALGKFIRASPVFLTPALLPPSAPESWRKFYTNAVVELGWGGSAEDLLFHLKRIELDLGRAPAKRWAPRKIDLDLLSLGDTVSGDGPCRVPHPEAWNRHFVLAPLLHLNPHFKFPGQAASALERSRQLPGRSPLWMGILNLTPDSFSDGGALSDPDCFARSVDRLERSGVQALDLGGESTRPGAPEVLEKEEWQRLQPSLEYLRERYHGKIFRPLVSVDTRHARVAANAIELGAHMINDVSGLADPAMLETICSSECHYVLMHSLSVPANPTLTLPADADPVAEILRWAEKKLENLEKRGISLDRVIFDPGVGFGKSAYQSLTILRRIGEFRSLPVRILVGHSRKSFFSLFSANRPALERDGLSIGVSVSLAHRGVELIRAHEAWQHADAWQAQQEVSNT